MSVIHPRFTICNFFTETAIYETLPAVMAKTLCYLVFPSHHSGQTLTETQPQGSYFSYIW